LVHAPVYLPLSQFPR